jgi:hypothetical protein
MFNPREFKVVALKECPMPEDMLLCDTPEKAVVYWDTHIKNHPYLNPDCECMVELLLNTRRRIKGHHLISQGTLDTLLVHPREVFRVAIMAGGVSGIILMHSHPSGDATPSEADIKVTRDLIRAGQLLKIEVLDHVNCGRGSAPILAIHGLFLLALAFIKRSCGVGTTTQRRFCSYQQQPKTKVNP